METAWHTWLFDWFRVKPRITVLVAIIVVVIDSLWCIYTDQRSNLAQRLPGIRTLCGYTDPSAAPFTGKRTRLTVRILEVVERANTPEAVETFDADEYIQKHLKSLGVVSVDVPSNSLAEEGEASRRPDAAAPSGGANSYVVCLRGKLYEPRTAHFPWDFDQKRYYQRQGIDATMRLIGGGSFKILGRLRDQKETNPWAWVDTIRSRMVGLHRSALGNVRGDLLSSMVIGEKAVRPTEEIRQKFRALGLSHIVAASGFNLTCVTIVAWWAIRFFVRSTLVVNGWCFLCICLFCLLAGFAPSVERAALMCSVILLANCWRKSVHLPASVAAALIITILFDPRSIFDVGLQLSYAATFAIALWISRVNEVCSSLKLPTLISEVVTVVLIANVAVLPLQLLYFWQIGALSLPANMLVSPLIAPITVMGFVSSAMAAFGQPLLNVLAGSLDWVNGWALDLMMFVVDHLSACSWSVLNLGPPPMQGVAIYYAMILVAFGLCPSALSARCAPQRIAVSVSLIVIACCVITWRRPLAGDTAVLFRDASLFVGRSGTAFAAGNTDAIGLKRAEVFLQVRSLTTIPLPALERLNAKRSNRQSAVLQECAGKTREVADVEQLFQ